MISRIAIKNNVVNLSTKAITQQKHVMDVKASKVKYASSWLQCKQEIVRVCPMSQWVGKIILFTYEYTHYIYNVFLLIINCNSSMYIKH